MTHLSVTPEDLLATAKALEAPVGQLDALPSQLAQAKVPSGAFGHIPGLGSHLYSSYDRHVTDSSDMLRNATAGVRAAAASLHATGAGMAQLESHTRDMIKKSAP